ncbi:MAG TPA: hypothetical protein VJB87_05785 [Candidatus Nanoarchaeia archaeon]|nr:hypothetical protein [Candidatus Nanoarchaeia archaeon]
MQKRYLFSILLISLFLAGCTGLGGSQEQTKNNAFVGGKQALSLGFLEGEPPAKVLDNNQEEFTITLLLRNEGEYTVPKGRILATLSGISKDSFGLKALTVKSDFDLEKRTKTRDQALVGGQEEINFGTVKYKPDLPADFPITMRADICYDYETTTVTSICLKKDVFARTDINDNCALDSTPQTENSGGPIQIINVRQRPTGTNKVRLSFDLTNQGVGAVYKPKSFNQVCTGNEEHKEEIGIEFKSTSAQNYPISCTKTNTNRGTYKLVNGIKTITCDIDTKNLQESSYTDFFIIKASYMYRDSVDLPIVIENSEY